jgi:hypothetical protein
MVDIHTLSKYYPQKAEKVKEAHPSLAIPAKTCHNAKTRKTSLKALAS